MNKALWIACAAVVALGGSAWAQGFIGGPDFDTTDAVTATASHSAVTQTDKVNAVNGTGLDETGEMHSNDDWSGAVAWLGDTPNFGNLNPGTWEGGIWIRFDFDQVYAIGSARIWNYNSALNARGMNQVVIEYSETGGTAPSDWTRLGGDENVVSFPQAPGENDYTGFTVNFGGVNAGSVVFTALSDEVGVANFGGTGNAGLAEVRFNLPGTACDPGDADRDGDVDDDDLSLLLANWGADVDCTKGEFSGVAPVNDDDLSLLLANWTGPLVAAVPEPTTMILISLAAPALLKLRRKA